MTHLVTRSSCYVCEVQTHVGLIVVLGKQINKCSNRAIWRILQAAPDGRLRPILLVKPLIHVSRCLRPFLHFLDNSGLMYPPAKVAPTGTFAASLRQLKNLITRFSDPWATSAEARYAATAFAPTNAFYLGTRGTTFFLRLG